MKFNSMYTLLIILTLLTILPHIYCESFELKSNTINTNLKPLIEGTLIHRLVTVPPRQHTHVDLSVTKDTRIIIDIYELANQEIDIEIVRPDGSIELSKTRVTNYPYRYEFTATMSGTYRIRLDNTFALAVSKQIQIAVSTDDPPHTVTETVTTTTEQTLAETNWLMISIISIMALIIGFLIGFVLSRARKK